jgi:hypothetical protein
MAGAVVELRAQAAQRLARLADAPGRARTAALPAVAVRNALDDYSAAWAESV